MSIVRRSGDPDQSGHALFVALPGAALSEWGAARTAVFAALDGLVEADFASWHGRWAKKTELQYIRGEAWLHDGGVTRLR